MRSDPQYADRNAEVLKRHEQREEAEAKMQARRYLIDQGIDPDDLAAVRAHALKLAKKGFKTVPGGRQNRPEPVRMTTEQVDGYEVPSEAWEEGRE